LEKKLYQLGKENGEKKQLQLVIELCKKNSTKLVDKQRN
jgi:hypothetical protein